MIETGEILKTEDGWIIEAIWGLNDILQEIQEDTEPENSPQ